MLTNTVLLQGVDCFKLQVKDMESMKYLMRYNSYKNDNYSLGSPMNAICSRGDLLDPPEAGGCYDTKVTDYYCHHSDS